MTSDNFLNHTLALEGCPGCPPQNGRLTTKGERWIISGEMRRTMMHVQFYMIMMVNLAATLRLNAVILLVVDCMNSLIHMISTTMHGLSFATSASPPAMTMFLLQNFQKTVMRGQQQ